MRSQAEIQRAHDQLVGLLLNEAPVELNGEERHALNVAAGVLCWILRHDHNAAFEVVLADLEERCRAVGFRLPPIGEPNGPRDVPAPPGWSGQINPFLLAGQITGLAFRLQAADFERAARDPALTPANAALVNIVAEFRRRLSEGAEGGGI